MNVRYVDDPFEEEGGGGKRQPPKKLFGSTDLQVRALEVTGRKKFGFRDNAQLKRFTDLEAFAGGADADSRVWAAWIAHRIDETKRLNAKGVIVNLDQLIHRIGMEDKREAWMVDNRAKVLQKPTAQQIAGQMGVRQGISEMEAQMQRRKKRE